MEAEKVKSALSDKKFIAFLDGDPDKGSFDPSDSEAVTAQLEKFQLKNNLVSALHNLYKDKIKNDTGLDLAEADLLAVDGFLTAEVRENPEELAELAAKIKEFNDLPKQIEAKIRYIYQDRDEARLKDQEMSLTDIEEPKTIAGITKKILRKINPWESGESEKELEEVRQKLRDINTEKWTTRHHAKAERSRMEARLAELKTELFDGSLAPTLIVADIARKKIAGEFEKIMRKDGDPDNKINELTTFKSELDKIAATPAEGAFDYNQESLAEDLAAQADNLLSFRAKLSVDRALASITDEDEEGPITKLEEGLKPFLEGDEKSKKLITDKIKRKIRDPRTSSAKVLILKILLAKIEFKEFEAGAGTDALKQSLNAARERIYKAFP